MVEPELLEALEKVEERIRESNERMADVDRRTDERIAELRSSVLTKDHFRKRRRQAFVIASVVAFLMLVLNHAAITKCFLSPSTAGWSKSTCSAMFPGYNKVRTISESRTKQFNDILAEVPVNQRKIGSLEERLSKVEAQRQEKQ